MLLIWGWRKFAHKIRNWQQAEEDRDGLKVKLLEQKEGRDEAEFVLREIRKVWEVDSIDLQYGPCIGMGSFAKVYSGKWRDMKVAIKLLTTLHALQMNDEETLREMDKEATMLLTLQHGHVVRFLGAGKTDDGEAVPFLVTELMELGPLTRLLYVTNSDGTIRPPISNSRGGEHA